MYMVPTRNVWIQHTLNTYTYHHVKCCINLCPFNCSLRLSPEEKKTQPLAGFIFRVKNLGTHGLPAVPFDG